MHRMSALLLLAWLAAPARLNGQTVQLGAAAAGLWTRADPIAAGEARTGTYLTQPVVTLDAALPGGAVSLRGMLNLEGLTLEDGELAPGAWGEGFIDKRHPHTYLHELVATGYLSAGDVRASLSAGRGFAPFGTDDPMSRPFLRFPGNHHLAQIPERLIAIAGVGVGPAVVEFGAFNGDEPTSARSIGTFDRFGDSWSTRLTLRPVSGIELQGSYAAVESPEVEFGGGADQRKWSASGRWQGAVAGAHVIALGEWARTTDYDQDVALYGFRAWLLELDVATGPWHTALRYEDATRPEEERTADRFRSPRPHTDLHLLGITRWRTLLAQVAFRTDLGSLRVAPLIEGGISHVDETAGGVLQPESFFGDDLIGTISVGIRMAVGHAHPRMGRYGIAAAPSAQPPHMEY